MSERPNGTKWSATQRKYMAWVATPDDLKEERKLGDFAQRIGIDRRTLWRWRKIPGFNEQVQEYTKQHLGDVLPEALQALKNFAAMGSFPHLKMYLEMLGMYTPKLAVDHRHIMLEELERIREHEGWTDEQHADAVREAERIFAGHS